MLSSCVFRQMVLPISIALIQSESANDRLGRQRGRPEGTADGLLERVDAFVDGDVGAEGSVISYRTVKVAYAWQ